jgi:hypothetical protein
MTATFPSFIARGPSRVPQTSYSEVEALQLRHEYGRWMPHFMFVLGVIGAFIAPSWQDFVCGALIALPAFLSIILWARRYVLGLPILPFVAIMYFLFYGLPFISGHPFTQEYEVTEKLTAAATTAIALTIILGLWVYIGSPRPLSKTRIRIINARKANRLFIAAVWVACAFQFNTLFAVFALSGEVFGVIRAVIGSLAMIALFGLGYQAGSSQLTRNATLLFLLGLILYLVLNVTTLYLITAMMLGLMTLMGYFLGGGSIPWKSTASALLILAILSASKAEIREKYWGADAGGLRDFSEAVSMLEEWFTSGLRAIGSDSSSESKSVSLAERASLTHMVLIAETQSPDPIPYLYGSSYTVIPELLVPRLLWPERPNTQEPLKRLSEHYGLLSGEALETVSIGWGLVSEAYANFGYLGVLGLAIALGVAVGYVQRWCGRTPVLSARAFAGLLFIVVLLAVEANMALLVTAFIQSMVPVLLASIFVMDTVQVPV